MAASQVDERRIAQRMLSRMFKELDENPSTYFSCGLIDGDVFKWRCTIFGPEGTPYAGGYFPSDIIFTEKFPNMPPKMRFVCPMWHPNIDPKTGAVCISILHDPGADPHEYESQAERWLPVHTVESIVVSVVSMLQAPNCESPLNVEASREYRFNPEEYNRKVRRTAEASCDYCT